MKVPDPKCRLSSDMAPYNMGVPNSQSNQIIKDICNLDVLDLAYILAGLLMEA